LFDLEAAFADVVSTSTQPALGAIRLAWWREALERLDTLPAPSEPRLQAVSAELLPRGVSGAKLAVIEDGFAALLDENPETERVGRGGAALFACAATLLGAEDPKLEVAGAAYALARAMRQGGVAPLNHRADVLAGHRFARSLRPVTGFARLAVRDLRQAPAMEAEATPRRAVALLSHRWFGTVA
jgi:phytoene synthase